MKLNVLSEKAHVVVGTDIWLRSIHETHKMRERLQLLLREGIRVVALLLCLLLGLDPEFDPGPWHRAAFRGHDDVVSAFLGSRLDERGQGRIEKG